MPKNLIKKKSRIHALFKILVYKDMCIRVDLAAAPKEQNLGNK